MQGGMKNKVINKWINPNDHQQNMTVTLLWRIFKGWKKNSKIQQRRVLEDGKSSFSFLSLLFSSLFFHPLSLSLFLSFKVVDFNFQAYRKIKCEVQFSYYLPPVVQY